MIQRRVSKPTIGHIQYVPNEYKQLIRLSEDQLDNFLELDSADERSAGLLFFYFFLIFVKSSSA